MNAAKRMPETAIPPGSLVNNPLAILVAEDDPGDVFLFKRAFSKACLKVPVIFVRDGQEVLDYLNGVTPFENRASNPWPGLLVLDLHMPRIDGFDLLGLMQRSSRLRQIPIIAFSGLEGPTIMTRAYELGVKFFLLKRSSIEQWATLLTRVADLYGLAGETLVLATDGARGPVLEANSSSTLKLAVLASDGRDL